MPPLSGDATPITPADSMENDDDDAKSDTSMKAIDGDKNDIPAAPTRPPPIPPRPQPQTTTQSKSKISIVEESARQQDAAEVMSNIFDLISCAIRGDGVLREGEQRDAIKKLFFSDVTTVLETGKGSEKLSELRDHLLVAPGQRNRSLYATLDDDFGQSEMEGGGGTRYDYIETAAPIQIINLRRIQFDRPKGQMVYDHSHIGLDTTMYLDRYLAKTPSLGEMQLLELRKAQWAKQQQLRELEAKRTRLQTTEIRDMNLSESLEESSNFIGELLTEKSDQPQLSQDTLPTPPPELADALHNRAKQLAEDLEGIDTLIAQLESEINTVFRDCHDVPYRLHAVFTHRGGVKGGHYWIYIYDFQNSTWRKYNDDMVDPVDESVVLDAETATAPKASTSVVYVRQDLADLYTEAVCRRPDHVGVEEAKSQDVEMHDANDEMPALEPAVPYHDVQIIEGVEKE
jgi:ubiquitin carboxyl-terminal hydrolase 25/28